LSFDSWSFDFTEGFTELHSTSYRHILEGGGFNEKAAEAAIEIVHNMREQELAPMGEDAHPLADLPLAAHPFYPKK
jgi:UDP-N-acetyl-2-amino-2-deoxyglucuronate dehydrogenase